MYLAGGGYFREANTLTDPGVATGFFDNLFFGFYPAEYETNFVVGSYSVIKPGLDGGVGIAFGNKWGGRFFAEARFGRIFSGAATTPIIYR